MTALSKSEIIKAKPIGQGLTAFRDTVNSTYKVQDILNLDTLRHIGDEGLKNLVLDLILALQSLQASRLLPSQSGNTNIFGNLSTLNSAVNSNNFDFERIKPLLSAVLNNDPDEFIWNRVYDAVKVVTVVLKPIPQSTTPPTSVPPTYDSTPIIHSSASQQGGEQTRKLVEQKVFEEIKNCTYRDVDGFFKKYFEKKDWTRRALDVYKVMKAQHVDDALAGLPDPPVQAEVLDWWFRLQDDFLSEEQRRYYSTTSPKDLEGAEAQRQIDLFVKRKNGQLLDVAHDWRDVEVIGKLKASNRDKKGTLLQLGRYVRDAFSCQPTRRYVHAFTICGRQMEVLVFDRSGCYSPGAFDIHEEPERFIQVITGYTMMNEDELGLDTCMEHDGDGGFIHIEQDGPGGMKRLQLDLNPITRQRAIVCRGTSCYLTKTLESANWDYVAKFSWTSDRRKPEADLLKLAQERGVEGIAKLIGHRRITSINEMRSGLTFKKPYPFRNAPSAASSFSQSFSQSRSPSLLSRSFSEFHGLSMTDKSSRKRNSNDLGRKPSKRSRPNSQRSSHPQNEVTYDVEEAQGTSLLAPNNGPYENRIFRCLVISPAGRAIYKYKEISELLGALRDAIKAHRSLYFKGNILHRDISENNIILTDPKKTGVMGMLIDLDLAKELGSGRSGARCRTGTMEFMAIEVLQGISHTYRHDLESFFYVLIWQCARRGWGEVWPGDTLLTKWYSGSYREIASAKRGHMHVDGFEDILEEFPPHFDRVKPLCKELRGILFPYREGLFVGTPKEPKVLYAPIIEAFSKAIDNIKATE